MPQNTQKRSALARKTRQIITQDLARHFTIAELAQTLDTSPTVLKEAFQAEFATSIYAWLKRQRMIVAARLIITTDLSIAEIGKCVGYTSPSKFTQAFKTICKRTPSSLRTAYRRHDNTLKSTNNHPPKG